MPENAVGEAAGPTNARARRLFPARQLARKQILAEPQRRDNPRTDSGIRLPKHHEEVSGVWTRHRVRRTNGFHDATAAIGVGAAIQFDEARPACCRISVAKSPDAPAIPCCGG